MARRRSVGEQCRLEAPVERWDRRGRGRRLTAGVDRRHPVGGSALDAARRRRCGAEADGAEPPFRPPRPSRPARGTGSRHLPVRSAARDARTPCVSAFRYIRVLRQATRSTREIGGSRVRSWRPKTTGPAQRGDDDRTPAVDVGLEVHLAAALGDVLRATCRDRRRPGPSRGPRGRCPSRRSSRAAPPRECRAGWP